MTTLRPEHDAAYGASHEPVPYEDDDAFEAAVDGLADPLNDPLPGQQQRVPWQPPAAPAPPGQRGRHRQEPVGGSDPAPHLTDTQRPSQQPPLPQRRPQAQQPQPQAQGQQPLMRRPEVRRATSPSTPSLSTTSQFPPPSPSAQSAVEQTLIAGLPADYAAAGTPGDPSHRLPPYAPEPGPVSETTRMPLMPENGPSPSSASGTVPMPMSGPGLDAQVPEAGAALDERTMALRLPDPGTTPVPGSDVESPVGGRADRRRAAAAKGGSGQGKLGRGRKSLANAGGPADEVAAGVQESAPSRPLSRIEARRAAKALKDSPGVVASRVLGELFITCGVLMLLFVTYQLWWTNVAADHYAGKETSKLQENFSQGKVPTKGQAAGAFQPGQGFAILYIPKLDVVAPIAQGVGKAEVLDHGEVGHYSEGALKTAMPSDKTGNFALAAHRNTHGEPFRYINQLKPGDKVVVETEDDYYTYEMTKTLPQTSPSNVSVISPVPPQSGFTKPGRYITLTTCTPEFTSKYRLIVWGKMVAEQPRTEGKPTALTGG